MNTYAYTCIPGPMGRPSREQQALDALLRRVNCNDRREPPDREIEEYTLRTRRLAAITYLGSVL
ncbi:hypothetical protein [Streptomyces sp. NPDC056796]|uniref:hypothetical protein n=1 Tax=unclassified Streptomyces TaxID=2593676 RepID=UPI0036CB2FD4